MGNSIKQNRIEHRRNIKKIIKHLKTELPYVKNVKLNTETEISISYTGLDNISKSVIINYCHLDDRSYELIFPNNYDKCLKKIGDILNDFISRGFTSENEAINEKRRLKRQQRMQKKIDIFYY